MKVIINHSEVDTVDGITVEDFLVEQNLAGDGIAVAVDNKVVPRVEWHTTPLSDGAKLTVIRAVCGG